MTEILGSQLLAFVGHVAMSATLVLAVTMPWRVMGGQGRTRVCAGVASICAWALVGGLPAIGLEFLRENLTFSIIAIAILPALTLAGWIGSILVQKAGIQRLDKFTFVGAIGLGAVTYFMVP